MDVLRLALLCLGLVVLANAVEVSTNVFAHRVLKARVTDDQDRLKRVTGMAASRVYQDILWMVDYRDNDNTLIALDTDTGKEVAVYNITGAVNYDWEDLAYGPCADDCRAKTCVPGEAVARFCLYIADIGMGAGGAVNNVYMIREPVLPSLLNDTVYTDAIDVVDKLTFTWPEPDAETLMIAPDGRLFVISKISTGRAMIAQIPDSGWGNTAVLDLANTAVLKILTTHSDPQGGSISPEGTEMLIVCEEDVYYFSVPDLDYIKAVGSQIPQNVASYMGVDDTEAITWSADGQGFYTFARAENAFLYYYPRNNNAVVG